MIKMNKWEQLIAYYKVTHYKIFKLNIDIYKFKNKIVRVTLDYNNWED